MVVTIEEWGSVLKFTELQAFFDFEKLGKDLRHLAIAAIDAHAELGEVSDVTLLSLGLKYSIDRWIACPAERLARRDEVLTDAEGDAIGQRAERVIYKIHHDSFQWLYLQDIEPENGRQAYPHFWARVKAGFSDDLAEDAEWLSELSESPCERIRPLRLFTLFADLT